MKLKPLHLLTLLGLFTLANACGGAQPAPEPTPAPAEVTPTPAPTVVSPTAETPPAPPSAPVEAPAPAPAPATAKPAAGSTKLWADMSKDEKLEVMRKHVMPKMKEEFAQWEPKHFSNMQCTACHGAGAKDKSFKMPNPDLPKLPANMEGFKKLAADKPEAMKFMKEKVMPETAEMLGLPLYNPATNQGFGCAACHTFAK